MHVYICIYVWMCMCVWGGWTGGITARHFCLAMYGLVIMLVAMQSFPDQTDHQCG